MTIRAKADDVGTVMLKISEEHLRNFVKISANRIIDRTPVDSGQAKASWTVTNNSQEGLANESPDPSGSKTKSKVSKEADKLDTKKNMFISSGEPYMEKLEFGSSKQAPAGMIRITAAESEEISRIALKITDTKVK